MSWFLFLADSPLSAMGFTEDPQEKLTKSFPMAPVRSLEIRGEVEFELIPGPIPQVTVEASRALFDQLNVSNWWGAATVAIESGLRGPRELGPVKIKLTLPSLRELNVSDHSTGHIIWPGTQGSLRIAEGSSASIELSGNDFTVATSWLTQVTLKGKVLHLRLDLRHQSQVNATGLSVQEALVTLDENSTYEAGPTIGGTGTIRHQSRITLESDEAWSRLVLKEGSVKAVRDPTPAPAPSN